MIIIPVISLSLLFFRLHGSSVWYLIVCMHEVLLARNVYPFLQAILLMERMFHLRHLIRTDIQQQMLLIATLNNALQRLLIVLSRLQMGETIMDGGRWILEESILSTMSLSTLVQTVRFCWDFFFSIARLYGFSILRPAEPKTKLLNIFASIWWGLILIAFLLVLSVTMRLFLLHVCRYVRICFSTFTPVHVSHPESFY